MTTATDLITQWEESEREKEAARLSHLDETHTELYAAATATVAPEHRTVFGWPETWPALTEPPTNTLTDDDVIIRFKDDGPQCTLYITGHTIELDGRPTHFRLCAALREKTIQVAIEYSTPICATNEDGYRTVKYEWKRSGIIGVPRTLDNPPHTDTAATSWKTLTSGLQILDSQVTPTTWTAPELGAMLAEATARLARDHAIKDSWVEITVKEALDDFTCMTWATTDTSVEKALDDPTIAAAYHQCRKRLMLSGAGVALVDHAHQEMQTVLANWETANAERWAAAEAYRARQLANAKEVIALRDLYVAQADANRKKAEELITATNQAAFRPFQVWELHYTATNRRKNPKDIEIFRVHSLTRPTELQGSLDEITAVRENGATERVVIAAYLDARLVVDYRQAPPANEPLPYFQKQEWADDLYLQAPPGQPMPTTDLPTNLDRIKRWDEILKEKGFALRRRNPKGFRHATARELSRIPAALADEWEIELDVPAADAGYRRPNRE